MLPPEIWRRKPLTFSWWINRQPVDPIERSSLVAFRQRWVVEYSVDEEIDLAAKRHDRLANMHQLTGTLTNDANAEQFVCFQVEDQLQQPRTIAHNLAARGFPVARLADLIWDSSLCQLFFAFADNGNLRDGVDAVWEMGAWRRFRER